MGCNPTLDCFIGHILPQAWGHGTVEEPLAAEHQPDTSPREPVRFSETRHGRRFHEVRSPLTTVTVPEKEKNVRFIVAGDRDRLHRTIDLAASLGIGRRLFFTRFLRGPTLTTHTG
jgi:hypothetical protein